MDPDFLARADRALRARLNDLGLTVLAFEPIDLDDFLERLGIFDPGG